MDVRFLSDLFKSNNVDFFTGVPDSQLKHFCNYLMDTYGISDNHIIAANEGNAVALAAGYHLATGKIPCVYLQNSGFGNVVNPITSLLSDKVYAIPCLFVIGWRGEPNLRDEPQHVFQGEITLELLDILDIDYIVVDKGTSEDEIAIRMNQFRSSLDLGRSVAIVVKKGALAYDQKVKYENDVPTIREDIIRHITKSSNEDIVISTTGKTSRELFENREQNNQSHKYDFLTVGSMGHSSSIALGVALNKPNTRVWCIDGDGAAIMHMGSMGLIGSMSPKNYIHVLINNEAHESVGGQPTVASSMDFRKIADGCGYKSSYLVENLNELDGVLHEIKDKEGPVFIEVKSAIRSRDDLGRPTSTPVENKTAFMKYLTERN